MDWDYARLSEPMSSSASPGCARTRLGLQAGHRGGCDKKRGRSPSPAPVGGGDTVRGAVPDVQLEAVAAALLVTEPAAHGRSHIGRDVAVDVGADPFRGTDLESVHSLTGVSSAGCSGRGSICKPG